MPEPFLDDDDTLWLHASDGERRPCDLCRKNRWCVEVTSKLHYLQSFEVHACETCLGKITRFAYDPDMKVFLRGFMEDFAEKIAWLENHEREKAEQKDAADEFGRKGEAWSMAVALLYRSLSAGITEDSQKVIVVKAVHALTGLDLMKSSALVAKVFAAEKAKGPTMGLAEVAMRCWREAGFRLDKKIEVIRRVREQTGLGLKEAKDLAEVVWDKLKQTAAQQANLPAPQQAASPVGVNGATSMS